MLDEAFPWEKQQTQPFPFEPGMMGPALRDARIVVTPAAAKRTEENVRRAAQRLPRSVRDAFLGGAGLIDGDVKEDDDSGLDGLFE